MAMGPPPGFAQALQRKYDILQQEADANSLMKQAQANQLRVQTGLAPGLANATIDRSTAATGLDQARTGLVGQQTRALRALDAPAGADVASFARLLQGTGGRGALPVSGGAKDAGSNRLKNQIFDNLAVTSRPSQGVTLRTLSVGDPGLERARKLREQLGF